MYSKKLIQDVEKELESLKKAGKFKIERELEGAQGPEVTIGGKKVLMFASNNYLGLSNHPEIVKSAREAIDTHGFGLSSVRFISGTETIHKILEKKLAEFLSTEDVILYVREVVRADEEENIEEGRNTHEIFLAGVHDVLHLFDDCLLFFVERLVDVL